MSSLPPILTAIAGLLLLFSGRRLFWLAAALAAFVLAYPLILSKFGNGLVPALVAGAIALVFAWLAIQFFRTVALVVGAISGAVGLSLLLGLLGIHWAWWLVALIGGVLGIIFISIALDWGLIVMTSWLGANLVAGDVQRLFTVSGGVATLIFLFLLAAGIIVQATSGRRARRYRS